MFLKTLKTNKCIADTYYFAYPALIPDFFFFSCYQNLTLDAIIPLYNYWQFLQRNQHFEESIYFLPPFHLQTDWIFKSNIEVIISFFAGMKFKIAFGKIIFFITMKLLLYKHCLQEGLATEDGKHSFEMCAITGGVVYGSA